MKRLAVSLLVLVVGVLSLVAVAVFVPEFIDAWTNDSLLYEFPESYNGWVRVQYGVPYCPALERREGLFGSGTLIHKFSHQAVFALAL